MKFFIKAISAGGNLAVEKFLYEYIRDTYLYAVVGQESVPYIITTIKAVRDEYLKRNPRAKTVNIEWWQPKGQNDGYLSVGNFSVNFIAVAKEI